MIQVPARPVGPDCTCNRQCSKLIGKEGLQAIRDAHRALDYNMQTADLIKKVKREETKQQKLLGDANPSRVKYHLTYTVKYQQRTYIVCKKAFCSMHAISESRIEAINQKRCEDTDTVIPDQRGLKGNHNAVPEDVKKVIYEAIESLPTRSSHYTREKNPNMRYIDLPDRKYMQYFYNTYVKYRNAYHPNVAIAKLTYFRYIWTTCYNIGVKNPRKDKCETCVDLNNKIYTAREAGRNTKKEEELLNEHKNKADMAYLHLKNARNKKIWKEQNFIVICIDLQKTHTIPHTNVGPHYYYRKLNVFNFCIIEMQTGIPYFYTWTEADGGKGSSEIYSCIYKWIKEHVLNKPNRAMRLRIIADNCGGQNKNNNVVLALLRLIHLQVFHRIELAFLVPGHSYMDCDRKFGQISRTLATYDSIPSPAHLREYIQLTQRSKTPCVFSLPRTEILDITVLTVTDATERVALIRRYGDSFQKASVIVMRKGFNNGYLLKKDFNDKDENSIFIEVNPPNADEGFDLGRVEFRIKYPQPKKLKKEKLDDLIKMRASLGVNGDWIDVLVEEQNNADTFTDQEEHSLFPPETLGRDYSGEYDPPVRIRNNAILDENEIQDEVDEEDEDTVDDPPSEDE